MTQAFVPLAAPPPAVGNVTEGRLAAVPPVSPALRRVDTVLDQLVVAEAAVAELVRSLQPVLPQDFPSHPETPAEPVFDGARSPLSMGLADLSARGGALVGHLRALCDAVDL